MNRIQHWASQTGFRAEPSTRVEQSSLKISECHGLYYSLFSPLHYEPNYAYPLLVWLHGPGENERQLQRIMPLISLRNYVAVAPRGANCLPDSPGFEWLQDDDSIATAEQAVFECVEIAARNYHVASHRVFLAGYGDGGTMALRIGLRHPQRFAGLLSISGPFPQGKAPLAKLALARELSLFIAHGRHSEVYPIDCACDELRLFHAAGLSVTLRQYPCGDELHARMLHDMNLWLMEEVTGISNCEASNSSRESN